MRLTLAYVLWLLTAIPAAAAECVVLLHGLARSEASLAVMEQALELEGYRVVRPGYPSTSATISDLAAATIPASLDACGDVRTHFVTHSLGGILVRQWLTDHDLDQLGHVVMLGPPNQGTELIDYFDELTGFEAINGPASVQLGTGPQSVPRALPRVDYPVGVIAGTQSLNPLFSSVIPGEDDGKVSVASTRVEGMTDHLELPVTHTFMMNNPRVIAETMHFLEFAEFDGQLTWIDGVRASLGCADDSCLPLILE